jgi:hypothetical protein
MVSKAAERSNRTRTEEQPLSLARQRSFTSATNAVSVLYPGLKPDWYGSRYSVSSKAKGICRATTLSTTFARKRRLETGRKLFKIAGSKAGFLRRGLTTASFKAAGKQPSLKEAFVTARSQPRVTSLAA